jgi:hypothetical protein
MKSTRMSLERGILFMEDGTEVSNVSVELLKHAPNLLYALDGLAEAAGEAIALRDVGLKIPNSVWSNIYACIIAAAAVIHKAKGESCLTSN